MKLIPHFTSEIGRKDIIHRGFIGWSGRINDTEQCANKNSKVITNSEKGRHCISKERSITTVNYLDWQ